MAKFNILLLILICSTIYVTNASRCMTYLLREHHWSYSCTSVKSSDLGPELMNAMKGQYEQQLPIELLLSKIKLPNSFNGELQTGWFNADVSVKYLHVRLFIITKIGTDAFKSKSFADLKELIITNMPSLTFTKGSFNGLENLKKLNLVAIKQHHFEANVLAPIADLQVLIIECNNYEPLLLDNLLGTTDMYQLIQVRIFHCNLSDTITETTFTGLKSVIELNLNENRIERLGDRSLDVVLQTIHYLHLSFNRLKSLPVELFENQRDSYLQITAHNNPWHCDSTMEKLYDFIHLNPSIKISTITCKTPPECNGFQVEASKEFCFEKIDGKITRGGVEVEATTNGEAANLLGNEKNEIQNTAALTTATPEANNEDLHIQCEFQKTKIKLTLSKKSPKKFPSIRIKKDKVEVDAAGASTDYHLVAIEETLNTNHQTLSCLASVNIGEMKIIDLHQYLKLNHLYRICWMEKGIDTISPLGCFAFHFYLMDVEDALLMIEHKPIAILVFTLVITLGFFIGVLLAMLPVKLCTKKDQHNSMKCEEITVSVKENVFVKEKVSMKKTDSTILMQKKRRVHFQPTLTIVE